MYFEGLLYQWSIGVAGGHDWNAARFAAWAAARNVACQQVHAAKPCCCDPEHWVELDDISELGAY